MTTRTIIPAGADWYVATLIYDIRDLDELEGELVFEPIIAWSIRHDEHEPAPITIEGIVGGDGFAIKKPNGKLLHHAIGFNDADEEHALAEMRGYAQRQKAWDEEEREQKRKARGEEAR